MSAQAGVAQEMLLAPAKGYRALGNEPGWILTLNRWEMVLVTNYGDSETRAPLPPPQIVDDALRYAVLLQAADEATQIGLTVDIRQQVCRDTMNGMPFPHTVSVEIGGNKLRGCGGDTVGLLIGRIWDLSRVAPKAELAFDARGGVSGFAGCNSFTGSYTLTGEGLSFSPLATTRKSCGEETDRAEIELLARLAETIAFDMSETGDLILQQPGDALIASSIAPK